MKRIKSIVAILLVCVLALSFAACKKTKQPTEKKNFDKQYENIHFYYQQGYPDNWEITYGNDGLELRVLDTKGSQEGNLCAKLFPNDSDKVSYCIYNYDTDSMMNTLKGISGNLMDPKSTYYFNDVFTEDEEKRDSFSFTSQEPEKVYPNHFEFHKVNYKFLKDGEEWLGTFYVSNYQYTKFILITMEAEKSVWDAQQETFGLMMEDFAFAGFETKDGK